MRTPRDTRGHGITPVRDREAPGSNPGPPTKNRIQIEVFACSVWPAGVTGRSQIFWKWVAAPSKWISNRQLNSLTALAQPIYQHAHGPRTVRHLSSEIQALDQENTAEDHEATADSDRQRPGRVGRGARTLTGLPPTYILDPNRGRSSQTHIAMPSRRPGTCSPNPRR